jgi:osmotically-inducible protein OsmY
MKTVDTFPKLLTTLLLVASLGACAAIEGRETAGQYVDDATITARIKADIVGDAALKVLQINVETMQGVVQLSGFVDSQKSEAKAVSIARHEEGVKSVKDNLIVR